MPTPETGTITFNDIIYELGRPGPLSFGDTDARLMAEVLTGEISISDFRGKGSREISYLFLEVSDTTGLDLSKALYFSYGLEFNGAGVVDIPSGSSGIIKVKGAILRDDFSETVNFGAVSPYITSIYGVASAKILNLSEYDLSYMFNNCTNLTSVDISQWFPGSSELICNNMFKNCSSLLSITGLSSNPNRTMGIISYTGMFDGCSSITRIAIDVSDTGQPISLKNSFNGCSSMAQLNITNIRSAVPHSNDIEGAFRGCSSLVDMDINFITMGGSSVILNMVNAFNGASSLKNLTLNTIIQSSSTDVTSIFTGCTSLNNIVSLDLTTPVITLLADKYQNDSTTPGNCTWKIGSPSLQPSGTYSKINWRYPNTLFLNVYTLTSAPDLSKVLKSYGVIRLKTGVATSIPSGYSGAIEIENAVAIDAYSYDNNFSSAFGDKITSMTGTLNMTNTTTLAYFFYRAMELRKCVLYDLKATNVLSLSYAFSGCKWVTDIELEGLTTQKLVYIINAFSECYKLKTIDLSGVSFDNIISMEGVFSMCQVVTSIKIPNRTTSALTNMKAAFWNCAKLISLDVSQFNTSSVTTFDGAFYQCSTLTSLNVASFSSASARLTSSMFGYCSSLTELEFSSAFTISSVTSCNSMFSNCRALTKLSISSFRTPSAQIMGYMFSDLRALTELSISRFTFKASLRDDDVGGMFYGCTYVKTFDVSYVTSAVALTFDLSYLIRLEKIVLIGSDRQTLVNFITALVVELTQNITVEISANADVSGLSYPNIIYVRV